MSRKDWRDISQVEGKDRDGAAGEVDQEGFLQGLGCEGFWKVGRA